MQPTTAGRAQRNAHRREVPAGGGRQALWQSDTAKPQLGRRCRPLALNISARCGSRGKNACTSVTQIFLLFYLYYAFQITHCSIPGPWELHSGREAVWNMPWQLAVSLSKLGAGPPASGSGQKVQQEGALPVDMGRQYAATKVLEKGQPCCNMGSSIANSHYKKCITNGALNRAAIW